jgi:hypothetical protein
MFFSVSPQKGFPRSTLQLPRPIVTNSYLVVVGTVFIMLAPPHEAELI